MFTDDDSYRLHYSKKYQTEVQQEQVDFGPVTYNKAHTVKWTDGGHFTRASKPQEALVEFTIMALCNIYIGTAGSTVWFIVQALNVKYNSKNFDFIQIIGNWHVPDHPTMKFRQQTAEIMQRAACHLIDPDTYNINNEQANVLNFLTDYHVKDIYDIIVDVLTDAPGRSMPSATLCKDHLLPKCRVAKLNRDKYNNTRQSQAGQHWFKALLNYKIRQLVMNHGPDAISIDMDKNGMVYLIDTFDHNQKTQTSSSSSSGNRYEDAPWYRGKKRTATSQD